jgi:hypothetical protein
VSSPVFRSSNGEIAESVDRLGARIALLSFSSWWKPWAMGMAFIVSLPLSLADHG